MLPALLISLACSPAPSSPPGELPWVRDTAQGVVDVGLEPVVDAHAEIGGLFEVSWEADTTGVSWVEYGLDGLLDQSTPEVSDEDELHDLVLLGLKLGREYDYRVCTLTEGGELLVSEVGTIQVPPPPADLVPAELLVHETDAHQGYVITSQTGHDTAYVTILDADGDYVWVWSSAPQTTISMVDLSPDGDFVVYEEQSRDLDIDENEVVEVPLDGKTDAVHTRTHNGHHAFSQLPDGSVARLSLEQRLVELGDRTELVSGDRLIEVRRGNGDPGEYEVVFDFFEDWDHDPGAELLSSPLWAGGRDWTHANSLVYLPGESEEEGDCYLGTRNLDAIFKIDRQTGALQWQLGGKSSDFDMPPADAWNLGHFSELWEGGLLLMDNGGPGDVSRVVEYTWDEDARTAEAVWEYPHPDGAWSYFLGDARRLPSDHVLVSWTPQGTLEEVRRDGEVVWRVELGPGGTVGRALWVPDLYDPLGEAE